MKITRYVPLFQNNRREMAGRTLLWGMLGSVALLVGACAGAQQGSGDVSSRGETPPCVGCALAGERTYQSDADSSYREVHPALLERVALRGRVGWVPLTRVTLTENAKCSFCHAVSPDAFALEWNGEMERRLPLWFPDAEVQILLPGLSVAEGDAPWLDGLLTRMKTGPWGNVDFYRERPVGGVVYGRPVPEELRAAVAALAKHLSMDYLWVPLGAWTEIRPGLGRRGGFRASAAVSLWDGRTGDLLYLHHADHVVRMTSRHPPDKGWGEYLVAQVEAQWNRVRTDRVRILEEEGP